MTVRPRYCGFALAFLLALILVFSPSPAFSQTETGTISGTITDQTGAVVAGADVKLTNVLTEITATTKSNDSGLYVFPTVRPSQYRMIVDKAGFKQVVLTDLTVNVQDTLSRNFSLRVGAVGESVTVSGDVTKMNTESAAVSTVVDSQFVENMPLNGRSFQSLISLTPGVVATTVGFGAPGQFSVDGQRSNTNYVTVDGVSANFGSGFTLPGIGQQAVSGTIPAFTGGGTNGLVSVDAMQEFRTQTSSYAPEFGRSPGAQISIATKSGTNQWHGTAYDYIRNNIFDARSWFDRPPLIQSPLRQNDFGGTFGGPIWRDHTFFFFSYEGLRLRQPKISDGTYFSSDAKSAVTGPWAHIMAAMPTGTGALVNPGCDNVTTPCARDLQASYSDPTTLDSYALRLDHKLTEKVTMFARYDHAPSMTKTSFLNYEGVTPANIDTVTVGVTAMVSPTMVNDFRGNWSRYTSDYHNVPQAAYGAVIPPMSAVAPAGYSGNVSYTDFANPAFSDFGVGTYSIATQRQLNFVDTLSRTVGSHQLEFGVDFRRINPKQNSGENLSFDAFQWASILNGTVDLFFNSTSNTVTAHMDNWSIFGQDTWKVAPRLTLTYGLRWEINRPPVSDTAGKPLYAVTGIFDTNAIEIVSKPIWNTQLDAFAPRIGAAFQVNSKTVVRGGFGLFYDLGYGSGVSLLMGGAFPYSRLSLTFGIPLDFSLSPYQPIPFTTTITPNSLGLAAVDPNLRLPVTYQWNAAVERELGSKQTITFTYVGANGQNLLHQDGILPPGSILLYPVAATRNAGISHYNALQWRYMRRMSHGLQALASYSYAHSRDMGSDDLGGALFPSISAVTLPPLTRSDFDIRNALSAAISYNIPNPTWGGKVGKALLNGWGLDGIYRYQSGPPLSVKLDYIDPVLGDRTVLAARVPGQPVWIPDPTQPAGKGLNPAAFTLGGTNRVSDDALRNSIQSPYGISQADFALRRSFHITERLGLELRAEYFNAFNHPMFGGPLGPSTYWGFCSNNTPVSCAPFSDFGQVSDRGTLNQGMSGIGGAAGTGQNAQYAVGGARSGQFMLRLTF